LVSLIASHSYHVVGGIASTADIGNAFLVADAPKLVILGALPAKDPAISHSLKRRPQGRSIRTVITFRRTDEMGKNLRLIGRTQRFLF
jgi:hypothetical protein